MSLRRGRPRPDNRADRVATGSGPDLAGASGQFGHEHGVDAAARLAGPTTVTSDGAGSLFITESGSNVIRAAGRGNGGIDTLPGVVTESPSTALTSDHRPPPVKATWPTLTDAALKS